MTYVCRYLQFGTKDSRVPGYDDDLSTSNEKAPLPESLSSKVIDPKTGKTTHDIWILYFSSRFGDFRRASDTVYGHDGDIINGWYVKEGNGSHHFLMMSPFIIWEDRSEGFDPTMDL